MAKQDRVLFDFKKIVLTKQKEIYIFTIFTLSILIILIFLVITPMLVNITQVQKEIEMKTALNKKLDTKIENLNSLQTEFMDIEDDLRDLPLIFPSDWNYSLFAVNVEEVCKKNNFILLNISFDDFDDHDDMREVEMEFIQPWNVQISVQGYPYNLKDFLEELEGLPTYTTVDSLSYSIDEDAERGLIDFRISMRIYYLNKPELYNLFDFD